MHQVKIVYCRPCGYLDRALETARDILQYFDDVKVELEQGKNGIFDVYIDGELKLSRYQLKRFPEINEILKEISNKKQIA
ncbi:SelT/SelW/SelH family protein [Metallosphaera hakonensis]|uniref:SelT/SelW/SelH family protein n=1 Tax=Metallosphaera hakonensis JCM 8857 = DSM 7519 TaxID=1293036 RepID=A0A2U9IRV2_9CREN|nr:Rdx family protein [Metallosphaera hakonensis]AWR98771.1 SelT/SelW/SelH family protein [Metallosphaera hakonensis JCM 8857 = DSM 7519]